MFYIVKFKDPVFVNCVKDNEQFKGKIESIGQYVRFLRKASENIPIEEKDELIYSICQYEKDIDYYVQINTPEENKELKLFLELLFKADIIDYYFSDIIDYYF